MYKESTERNHASASTLAPQSSFPTKARTLLHPICSSPPTPLPLRSSPAQTDLPRSQLFPYPPPYLLIHDRTPSTPLFPPPKRSSSSSAFPLPSAQITLPRPPHSHTLSPTNEERSRAFLAMGIEWIDEKGICKQ